MAADSDDELVTDLMIGLWFVIAADLMALTGFAWIGGYVSRALFIAVTVATNAVFAGWLGWRWYAIRQARTADRSAVETLKRRYAAGEIGDREFETRLESLIGSDAVTSDEIDAVDSDQTDAADRPTADAAAPTDTPGRTDEPGQTGEAAASETAEPDSARE